MKSDFFTQLGIFVAAHFLDPETCRETRNEIQTASAKAGSIGPIGEIDPEVRRACFHKVNEEIESRIKALLMEIKPRLEEHFQLELVGCQKLQFLSYKIGDFYLPHWDNSPTEELADFIKARKVSVVVFLNSENGNSLQDTFSGGSLTFYGLMSHPRLKNRGFGLDIEEGLLIAFRSTMVHEVKPVTMGERFSIVTWFY